MLSLISTILGTSPPPRPLRSINAVRVSLVHAQPYLCKPCHLNPYSHNYAFYRYFSLCIRFHHLWKVDHCRLCNKALLVSFALRLTYLPNHELSTLSFRHAPHNCFKMNDKVVCVMLSYDYVLYIDTRISRRTRVSQSSIHSFYWYNRKYYYLCALINCLIKT